MIQRPNQTARPNRVLVIDDDAAVKSAFAEALDSDRVELRGASDAAEGLRQIEAWQPDLVVLDHGLAGRKGLEVLTEITQRACHLPILILTAAQSVSTTIEAMKLGAFDCATKPVSLDQLSEQVERALESRRLLRMPVVTQHREPDAEAGPLVGRCSAMQRVYKTIGRLAAHDLPCLIQGEPGTGKKLVARTIHAYGCRADRPLVAAQAAAGDGALYGQAIERLERGLLSATLEATGGNLAHAARILGMTRVSLRKKIQRLGLAIPGRQSDA